MGDSMRNNPLLHTQAAKRRGHNPEQVATNLQSITQLLPDLINLHKMPANDWVRVEWEAGSGQRRQGWQQWPTPSF